MQEITCDTLGRACGFAKKAHKGQMYDDDTDTEVEEIEKVFGWDVAVNVWDLTRQKGQSYQDYLQNLACDVILAKVKWADSYVNLMKCIETGQFSCGKKYMSNLEYLNRIIESGGE